MLLSIVLNCTTHKSKVGFCSTWDLGLKVRYSKIQYIQSSIIIFPYFPYEIWPFKGVFVPLHPHFDLEVWEPRISAAGIGDVSGSIHLGTLEEII